jgi:hypothetical protein
VASSETEQHGRYPVGPVAVDEDGEIAAANRLIVANDEERNEKDTQHHRHHQILWTRLRIKAKINIFARDISDLSLTQGSTEAVIDPTMAKKLKVRKQVISVKYFSLMKKLGSDILISAIYQIYKPCLNNARPRVYPNALPGRWKG